MHRKACEPTSDYMMLLFDCVIAVEPVLNKAFRDHNQRGVASSTHSLVRAAAAESIHSMSDLARIASVSVAPRLLPMATEVRLESSDIVDQGHGVAIDTLHTFPKPVPPFTTLVLPSRRKPALRRCGCLPPKTKREQSK